MYELEGQQFSLQQLQDHASQNNIDFDSYMKTMNNAGMIKLPEKKDTSIDENVFISTLQNYLDRPEGSRLIKSTIAPLVLGITRNVAGLTPEVEETDPFANETLNDIFNDFYRETAKGYAQGETVGPQLRLQEALRQGKEFNKEDIIKLAENAAKINNLGTTDEARAYQSTYDKNKEKYNGFTAFFLALGENPTFALTTTTSSLARMAGAFVSDEKVRSEAIGKGIFTVGGVLAAGQLGPQAFTPEEFITGPVAFMSGVFSSVGGSLEQATTFQEIIQESLKNDGKDFTPENIKSFLNDKEVITFKSPRGSLFDITGTRAEIARKRAVKRGIAIETVDMFTGLLGGGLVKRAVKTGATKKTIAAIGTTAAVGGGLTSETLGQIAGGQELEVGEILLEGIAEKAFAMTGITTVPSLLKKRAVYKLNGQTVTEQELLRELNKMSDVEIAEMQDQIEIKNDSFTKNRIRQRANRGRYEAQVSERVTDKADRKLLAKKLAELDREKAKDASKKKKNDVLSPFVEAQNDNITLLENQIKNILNKYQGADSKAFQDRNKKIRLARLRFLKNEITEGVKKTKAYKKMDISAEEGSADEAFAKFFAQEEQNLLYDLALLNENLEQATDNKTKRQIRKKIKEVEAEYNSLEQTAQEARTAQGFLLEDNATGKMTIFINEDVAMTDGININVAAHELLHAVLRNTFLTEKGFRAREAKGAGLQTGQSLLNYLLENKEGELLIDGGILNRLKSYSNASGDIQGQEVLNLLSDAFVNTQYQSKAENFLLGFGERLSDILKAYLPEKYANQLNFANGKQVFDFVKTFNKAVRGDRVANRIIERVSRRGIDVSENITKEETGKASKAPMSKAASDRVQEIYENKGVNGILEIAEQFKPITTRLARKYRNVPGYDEELLIDEIETGRRGMYDLVIEYNPNSNVPLAAYINKFLPARAIEAANRILETEFTQDVSERVDIAAEETTVEVETKPKPKKIVLADRLGVTDKVSKAINKIAPNLNVDKLSFKTVKNEVPEITGDLFGISSKKIQTLANLTKKELQSAQMFINKNADLLIAMLPEGATASGTATGVPRTLLNEFYIKGERAKMAKTGTKAGLAIQQKKSNITKKQFLEVFGIIDGKPQRDDRNTSARVLALANLTGKMITNQAIRQEEASINLTKEAVNKLEDGKSSVMFSKQGLKNNLNKHTGEQMLNNKSGNDRNIYKFFVERILPEYVIPYVGADTFGPNTSLEKNIKQGYFNSSAERNKMKENAIKNRKALKNENKLKTKHTLEQEKQMETFVKDKRNSGFKDLFTPGYNKTIEDHFKGAELYFKGLSKAWQDGSASEVTAMLQSSPAASGHIMRLLGLPKGLHNDVKVVEKGKLIDTKQKNLKNKPTKEHTLQNSEATDMMAQAIAIGPEAVGRLIKYFKKHYYMIGLSFEDTAKVDQHFKNNQPQEFQDKLNEVFIPYLKGEVSIDQMPDPMMKMVHPKVNNTRDGIDLDNIKMNDGKTVREKYFGASNENIFKYLTGEVSIDYLKQSGKVKLVKNRQTKIKIIDKAVSNARVYAFSKTSKGISILDFDDTLATTESLVKFTAPDGKTGTLNAEQYASTYEDLLDQGFTFDFSDFNKVVKGKLAPLFNKALKLQKKFGPENMFVLTARPPAAQKPIFEFLKANGLNIPLKNITGLGNSTSEAKALWVADKVGEGYNDFYFADDALQNVQAVDNVLEQFDVKRKVQQARVQFSKGINETFNDIIEDVKGIDSQKRYSQAKARKRGEGKGRFRFFIPPSHEDFVGLLYNFIGKGEKGNKHRDFFEKALIKPLNRAYNELNVAKQSIANDYRALIKAFPDIRKKLTKKTPDGDFYYSDAIRVYLWNKAGFDIPGMSKTDIQELVDLVTSEGELQAFADNIGLISKQEQGYVEPSEEWQAGDIRTDLQDATGRVGRKKFFAEFIENADIIFSQENLNKIEAAYGRNFREALQDILDRTKTGTNRNVGPNKLVNRFLDYINGSIGATMFFNARSAVLQTISTVNFINFGDNNIFAASRAFANQKQFWSDFAMLFNSDMLKQRRAGVAFDVNASEIANVVSKSKEPVRAAIKYLLQIGFLPTQLADSFAISLGGATMYRNRVKTYLKQGLEQKEAETKAFNDFQEISESTQQSARPDKISQQQASVLGRMILAFQNTPSQYVRLMKKAGLDLINRRKTPPYDSQVKSDMSNISKIIYYGAIQNIIFYSLQSAMFAMLFEDDEKDEEFFEKKRDRILNGSLDTILRGMGVGGAVISTIKNTAIKFAENQNKGWGKEDNIIMMEMLQLSPPIGIKARKLSSAQKTMDYNKKVIEEMDTFDIDNPVYSAIGNLIEATTNIPLARLHRKTMNLREAANAENEWWQRLAMALGWSRWDVGVENKEVEAVKKEIKERNKKGKFKTKFKTKF